MGVAHQVIPVFVTPRDLGDDDGPGPTDSAPDGLGDSWHHLNVGGQLAEKAILRASTDNMDDVKLSVGQRGGLGQGACKRSSQRIKNAPDDHRRFHPTVGTQHGFGNTSRHVSRDNKDRNDQGR